MSQIARDVLAIPVSIVASKSAFSTGGRVLDEYRSSLTPDMVEALILTQNWLRSSLFVDSTTNLQALVEENEFINALTEGINISGYLFTYLFLRFVYFKSYLLQVFLSHVELCKSTHADHPSVLI